MAKYEAPRVSSERTAKSALDALFESPTLFASDDWPELFDGLAKSGVYAWWVDASGARELSEGLGARVKTGCVFAGQAGGTIWPDGNASHHTLLSRIKGEQLDGITSRSAFRRTLAGALKKQLRLKANESAKLTASSEAKLTAWMYEHLSIAVFQCVNRDELINLESRLRPQINAQLSFNGLPKNKVRTNADDLRKDLAVA